MPEINGKQWTKEQIHAALKDGRVEEIWPGATFERIDASGNTVDEAADWDGKFGWVVYPDESRIKFNFDPKFKG